MSERGAPHLQTSATQSRAATLFGIGSGTAVEWFDWGGYTSGCRWTCGAGRASPKRVSPPLR